jgi:hypothetical protein
MAGLEDGVFNKGNRRLLGFVDTQVALGNWRHAQRRQQLRQFGDFPFVIAGDDEFFGHSA